MVQSKDKSSMPRMSDEAVKAKTGKAWTEWFSILDRAGAKTKSHQEIVKYLHDEHDVGPWWTQMVTVTYEQARGLREKHQKPNGYEISVSRTINAPIAKLFKRFANEKERSAWLGQDGLEVRTQSINKSMRATWHDKKTSLDVSFIAKNETKTQVTVQHSKLRDAKAAARMKSYWSDALDRLKASLK